MNVEAHTPLGFPRELKSSHTANAWARLPRTQDAGENPTLTRTFTSHSGDQKGCVVLLPRTYHSTLSRASKDRARRPLSVAFLSDRRAITGRQLGPFPGTQESPTIQYKGLSGPPKSA